MIQPGIMFTTLASFPFDSMSVQTAPPPDPTSDHLQRCMDSVQELAKTITCAIDKWHGSGLLDVFDIHGTYAKVSAYLEQLPADVECMRCTRRTYKSALHNNASSRVSLPATCTCDANPELAKRRRTSTAPREVPATDQSKLPGLVVDTAMSLRRSSCDPWQAPHSWAKHNPVTLAAPPPPPEIADPFGVPLAEMPQFSTQKEYDHWAAVGQPVMRDGQQHEKPDEAFDALMAQQFTQTAAGQVVDATPAAEPPGKSKMRGGRVRTRHIPAPPADAVVAGPSTATETPAFNTREEYEHWVANGEPLAAVVDPVVVVADATKPKQKSKKISGFAAWMASAPAIKPPERRQVQGPQPQQRQQQQQQQQQQVAQAHSSPLRRPGQVTPAIRLTTEVPYTPDSQVQPQDSDSHHTSATSLYAPYAYEATPTYFEDLPCSLHLNIQVQPQVRPSDGGIALPISDDPDLSRPISPGQMIVPNTRKRSFSAMSHDPPHMQMLPTDQQSPQEVAYDTPPNGIEDAGHKVQRLIKRGDPPQARDGKYYCSFATECADQHFDRKCQWR
jgi:hypothetical protein